MNSQSKRKLFFENIVIYGIGGVLGKMIPIIMVPIVTRLLPKTDYFGYSDLTNTIITFAGCLALMGMYDGMSRMFFEREDEIYKKKVCSTSLLFTLGSSTVVFIALVLFRRTISQLVFEDKKYSYLVIIASLATIIGTSQTIIAAPTRFQNKRKTYILISTIGPLIAYSFALILIAQGYYIIALPVGTIVANVITQLSFWMTNHRWFSFALFDKNILRQILAIAIPCIPATIVYWVFNSCDRIMITNTLGVSYAGVYAVSSKFGHMSQLIYTAFAGGWQYFSYSTMRDSDQVKVRTIIFEYMGVLALASSIVVAVISYPVFKFLFKSDYMSGYISAAYLFMAPLALMLFQISANQFLVIKKSWPAMIILSIGAIINIALNKMLIPRFGIEGASVATLSGYVLSIVVASIILVRLKLIVITSRFKICLLVCVIFYSLWRLLFSEKIYIGMIVAIVCLCFYVFLFKNDIKRVMNKR